MEELLTFLVQQISGSAPLAINKSTEEDTTVYTVVVPKEHMAILIGKQGSIISSIRTLARVKATQEGTRINVELQESPVS